MVAAEVIIMTQNAVPGVSSRNDGNHASHSGCVHAPENIVPQQNPQPDKTDSSNQESLGRIQNKTRTKKGKVKPQSGKQTGGSSGSKGRGKGRGKRSASDAAKEETAGEKKVPLFEQPLSVEGRRGRKRTDLFTVTFEKKDEEPKVEMPNGKGTSLGKIPAVKYQLQRIPLNVMKMLHKFLFGRLGPSKEWMLHNIEEFKGFNFDDKSAEYAKKISVLSKIRYMDLKRIAVVLYVKNARKDDLAVDILDYLVAPKDLKIVPPVARPHRRGTNVDYSGLDTDTVEKEEKKPKKKKTVKKSLLVEGEETEK